MPREIPEVKPGIPWLQGEQEEGGFTIQRLSASAFWPARVFIDLFPSEDLAKEGTDPVITICVHEKDLVTALEQAGVK